MPIKTRLTTKGFEAYLERIASAGQDVDAAADAALTAGGLILQDGLRQRVPKDTGNLEAHIGISAVKRDGNNHYIDVGILKGTDPNTIRYAFSQEFGWGDKKGHKAGQPYIRPTLDNDMKKARMEMRKILESWGLI